MRSFISTAALAVGASAAALHPRQSADSCCFGITVNGGHQSGSLGQLDDGQNRVGPGFGGASFCISGTTIYDSANRGCVIAMPQTQFQCDLNGTPTPGFSVTSSGEIAYQGNTTFYECAATANMQFNIYTTPYESYCAPVTLTTTGGKCAASSSSTCSAVTSTTTAVSVSTATVTASVVETAPGTTVTAYATVSGAGQTVTETSTVVSTVVQTAAGTTVTAPGTTVTAYATVSGAEQTVTETSTVVSTVVQTAPGTTVTAPGTTVTAYATVSGVCSTVTEVSTLTQLSTVTAPPSTVTLTVTGPGKTVVQTETTKQTETAETTIVQTAPGTTVQITETQVNTVSVTPATSTITATPAPSTSTTSKAPSTTSNACPPNLSGSYQYPHLIVPVNSSSPNTAYGTQYNGTVTPTVSTIFNFDIPASYSGETCSLIFLLPYLNQLETSSYSLTGSGSVDFLELSSVATASTTYNNAPSVKSDLGTFSVQPGSSTVVATMTCAAGQSVAYELKATGSYSLEFFQDWNPSPLGLYIRAC